MSSLFSRSNRRLTVDVYQTHGRIALESGDMEEYNQCQSRLKELHLAGVPGVSMDEFTGYRLIYSLYRENHRRERGRGHGRKNTGCLVWTKLSTWYTMFHAHVFSAPPLTLHEYTSCVTRHPLLVVLWF